MLTLYGIRSCDSCRAARRWLDAHQLKYRYRDVRDDGLDAATLGRWSKAVGWEPLVNTRSLTWRKVPETDRDGMDEKLAIATLLDYPTLLKRPVLYGDRVLEIGFDEDRYEELLSRFGR